MSFVKKSMKREVNGKEMMYRKSQNLLFYLKLLLFYLLIIYYYNG